MKSSRVISRLRFLYETDVSRTVSVIIIRIKSLMMMMMMMMTMMMTMMMMMMMMLAEMMLETSASYRHLTWPIAREYFIEFSSHESLRSYISFAN